MLLEIRSNTGEVKIVAAPSDNDRETAGIQQDSALSLSFTAFECVALDVYDYVDFLGRRYILTEAYKPQMNARGEWAYSVKFSGVEALAAQTLMVNPTDGTDNPVVTLTAPVAEHAALIVANLNRRTGSSDWQVGEVIETPYLDIDYTGKNAAEAVAALAEAAGTEWWFDAMTLNICRCEFGEPIELEYGGILLGGIKRGVADGADFFTRLFPIGSSRNIDVDKYGHARLQLPDGSAYVDSRTELGIIERFEEDAFAGIYPRRIGTVGAVRSETRTGDDGVDYTVWFFTDPDLPFNPNDYEIGGLVKNVTFQTGELRGRVFEVNYDTRSGEFEIITQWPYDNGVQLPTPPMIPASGDEYILWNISMPESYYPAAEQEYAEAVAAFIADRQKDVSVFTASTDYTVATPVAGQLRPGRRVRIKSEEYFPETGWRETRIISVSRSVANVGSMTLTMSDVLSSGRIQAIESGLNEVRGATSKISSSLSSKNESLARKLDKSAFYDLFEKVNIGTTSEPKYAIHAKYGLYTDSFLSALGLNPNTGGGGGGGATALSELSDVQLSGLLTGDVLIYDGTHWVNRPQSSIVPDLSEYATREWVQQQGYATSAALAAHAGDVAIHISSAERTLWNKTAADFAAIVGPDSDDIINKWEEVVAFLDTYTEADTLANLLSNKVDKVAGYGLSKNDFTDALLSKLNGIDAGANRYIHPTGGADAAIDDAAGRVLAGITVNALGHVTSVSSKTLAAADIPTLSISKVSGLQDALDGKLDKAEFYKYFEEVNIGTAEAPVYATRSKRGLFSDSFLSALGLNSSGGGGSGGGSYDRLDLWSDYTSERAGWVLSAGLGYDLYNRVRSLEGGSALSFTTEGTGNVVTAVKKSGTAVVVTKGLTALTSHQPIYALNFQAGAFEAKKYTPNTGAQTVNIPTKTSHLSNDSGFLTSAALTGYATQSWVQGLGYITAATANATFATKLGVSGNQIGTYVGGKLGNLITVPYATNADMWTGELLSSFVMRKHYTLNLTSLPNTNFYPVVFTANFLELDCDIRSQDGVVTAAYNMNHIHFLLKANGWTDMIKRFVVLSQANYQDGETTIGAVGYGDKQGAVCVWLRGGLQYYFVSNRAPSLKTTDYTYGSEIYAVGTSLSGGANQNVIIVWQNDETRSNSTVALQGGNVASATKLQTARTIWGQSFDGAAPVSGNMTGVGSISASGEIVTTSSSAFRMVYGSYGTFFLQDGSSLYLMLTNANDQYGSFNNLRPLQVTLGTGDVSLCSTIYVKHSEGNVGIGTSTPSYKLDVAGDIHSSEYIRADKAVLAPFLRGNTSNGAFVGDAVEGLGEGFTGLLLYSYGYTPIHMATSGYVRAIITAGGDVGIGTSSPAYKLDVAGEARLQNRLYFGDSAHYIELDENGYFHFSHGVYTDGFLSALGLNSSGSTISLWGNTYDGKNSIDGVIRSIYAADPTEGTIIGKFLAKKSDPLGLILRTYTNGAVSLQSQRENDNLKRFVLALNPLGGNVAINQTSASYTLDVAGTIKASVDIIATGTVTAKDFIKPSDARLKTYMEDVTLSVADVAEAPVYRFAWINGGGIDVGSTAQYWAARVPELTHRLPDGIHLGLDYGKAALLSVVAVARATADHERRIADIERQLQNRTI